ncbi:nuclear transport factor 2 family protein [Dinghuibacter silviterrae]|uniref:SnoaL-like protein n=1 Tax=Dinghuibacter silviterrae TaxID=1539049 RepID=A0A4R8DGW2_9BACT|nr:nuclear transport factor 2 family protein [Dinghuibacter silviterrae]TDW96755.1 SnoaL-like protein [Dinghuibacter silviterrae]
MSTVAFFDFVTAINARDAERLHSLMTPDHVFLDAIGNRVNGADAARDGWIKYFHWFPDYAIELTDALETAHTVLATGFAMGTYLGIPGENHWRIPAAWKAQILGDQISHWQVYADTKIPFDIIDRHAAVSPDGARVTSIGGVFFKCREPEKLKEWYTRHLGLRTDAYGTSFAWRQWDGRRKGFTAWSPFPPDTNYFAPSDKDFMFNYRVVHIESLVAQLREEGVVVLDEIEAYPYGKFVHILDPENNKIELWESDDEAYSKILGAVTR